MSKSTPGVRYSEVERESGETRVRAVLALDGGRRRDVSTGIGFFDHMLQLFAFHGQFDLGISAEGDLHVDDHHTVEDVGIVLGKAIREATTLSDTIERYASNHTAMDEALVLVAVDISGRGSFHTDLSFKRDQIGTLSTECILEFFKSLAMHAGITLHIRKIAGENEHHICEAAFKGFGRAMFAATRVSDRYGPSSTKGLID